MTSAHQSWSKATSTCAARSGRLTSPSGSMPSACGSFSALPSPTTQLERLKLRTERYCVVLQTLLTPPAIEASWDVPS